MDTDLEGQCEMSIARQDIFCCLNFNRNVLNPFVYYLGLSEGLSFADVCSDLLVTTGHLQADREKLLPFYGKLIMQHADIPQVCLV